jgi:hypothetical protein
MREGGTLGELMGKPDPSGKLAAQAKREADAMKIQEQQLAELKKLNAKGPSPAVAL